VAIQTTGLKYTSVGVDQFIQNVQKASKNLQDMTNNATASSKAIRQAAADLRTHSNSLNAAISGNKSLANAFKATGTSVSQSSGFFSNLIKSSSGVSGIFSKIGSALSPIPKAFGNLASSAGSSIANLLGFGKAAQDTGLHLDNLLKRIVAVSLVYGSISAVKGWIETGYEQVLLYDQLQSSLQTLIAKEMVEQGQSDSMGKAWNDSAAKAQDLTNWVEKLGILSIFDSADIKNVMQMAMSVGILTNDAKALSLALVDWGSVTKATGHQLATVTNAITDMFTKGRVQGEEMRQLARNGIPAWEYLAEALGKTTAQTRQMVTDGLVPADKGIKAIVDGMEKDFPGAASRMSTSLVGLTSSLKDLKNISLRELFAPAIKAVMPQLERFVTVLQTPEVRQKLNEWGDALGDVAVKAINFAEAMFASGDPIGYIALQIDKVVPGFFRFAESLKGLGSLFIDIAQEALSWGFNIGASLGEGIVQAASYIVQALSYIGNIIASWLRPGSPPRLLPELDDWGKGAAEVYVGGWGLIDASTIGGSFTALESGIFTALDDINPEQAGQQTAQRYLKAWSSADMSALKDIEKPIKEFLENMVSAGSIKDIDLIPTLLGGKDAIAKAIQEIDSFGSTTQDTLDDIHSWISDVNPGLSGLVDSFLEWEKASKAVKDAQDDLNRVNEEFEDRIKGIKDAYDSTLDPLKKSLAANEKQQKALKDQERIKKLNETISSDDSTTDEKRAAQLEIEEIQIRQQIDAVEERRDTELSAIEDQKKAAVDAATAALDQAKLQEEATKAIYDTKQAQIALEHDHNTLLAEQTRLLDSIKQKQEAAAKKGAGGGGGNPFGRIPQFEKASFEGGALGLDQGPLAELDKAMQGLNERASEAKQHWADLKTAFEEAKTKALEIKAAVEPLTPLAAGVGMAFGIIAAGGIASFIARIVGLTSPIGILITAGSLLYTAWQSNFMGIQQLVEQAFGSVSISTSTVTDLWNNTLMPAISSVANWFTTELFPVLIQLGTIIWPLLVSAGGLVASLFTNVLVPAASLAWDLFKNYGVPILGILAQALSFVFDVVSTYVLPIFKTFFEFIQNIVIPVINKHIEIINVLARVLGEILRLAFEAIKVVVDGFIGQIQLLGEKVGEAVDWLFGPGSMEYAIKTVSDAFDDAIDLVRDFTGGIAGMKQTIDNAIKWIRDFADSLSNIHIPDVLTPGSPTPFEMGLRGITDAMYGLNVALGLAPAAFGKLDGKTTDIIKQLEEAQKKAADLVEEFTQMKLNSAINELGQSLNNFRFSNEMYDGLDELRDKIGELKLQYRDLINEGKYDEANQIAGQISPLEEQARQLSDLQNRTDNAMQSARDEYMRLAQQDPENAKDLYDLKSKQIQELAELDQKAIMAKTDEERNRYLAEKAFVMEQQKYELELFNHQAQERTDKMKEQIDEILQYWEDAWKDLTLPEGINNPEYWELFKVIAALHSLGLPDWLTPGSPTPLENALVGITKAVRTLSSVEFPAFRAELGQMARVQDPSTIARSVINNYTNTNQYNLGVTTNQSPNSVYQSYEIMRSIYG